MRFSTLRRLIIVGGFFFVLWMMILVKSNDELFPFNRQNFGVESEFANSPKIGIPKRMENKIPQIFLERQSTLLEVCKTNGSDYISKNSEAVVRNHFVVDRKHQFIYCAMEKIGSTFWRRLFQIIVGSSDAKSPFDIPPGGALGGNVETFKSMSFDDIHKCLNNFKKFIIVRDPYARLFSGYMDKIYSANSMFWGMIGKFAVKNFRPDASKKSLDCGHDLTFPEFVKYFIFSETTNKNRDGHFLPMYDHCRPCNVKYDFIAKMETMSEDTLSVLKILNLTTLHDTLSGQFQEDTRTDSFTDQTNILYGSFKATNMCLPIYENQKRMWFKFQTRGLISKYANFPFTSKESENLPKQQYIEALKDAVRETKYTKLSDEYRYEYLKQAYFKVPKEDIRKLHQILKLDCVVFGYECDSYPWVIDAFRP